MSAAPEGMEEVEKELLSEIIGVGVHTGLRKGSDAEDSHTLWKAISDSETTAWADAADYAAWAFKEMGWVVYRPTT